MRWRLNGADGAAGAKALAAPSTTWYLAEGNAGFFDTYVLLANPSATPTTATVDFLLDGGGVRPARLLARRQRALHDLDEPDSRAGHASRSRPP